MESVFISGLGMIGSSLARNIKQGNQQVKILGYDPELVNGEFLISEHDVDQLTSFDSGAESADVIFLCGPVDVIKQQITELATLNLKKDVVVTDVGSTKQEIMSVAHQLRDKQITFVGGHPMAGSHLTGARSGRSDLFVGAAYFLIPTSADNAGVVRIQRLLSNANVNWQLVTAKEHDSFVGAGSHLPHIIASTLALSALKTIDNTTVDAKLVAGGFRDTTRIAAADPDMWTAIMDSNREIILEQLNQFNDELKKLKTAIEQKNKAQIHDFFSDAQKIRKTIDRR